jgi:hypothetical protein
MSDTMNRRRALAMLAVAPLARAALPPALEAVPAPTPSDATVHQAAWDAIERAIARMGAALGADGRRSATPDCAAWWT